jgi:hypothetical protein
MGVGGRVASTAAGDVLLAALFSRRDAAEPWLSKAIRPIVQMAATRTPALRHRSVLVLGLLSGAVAG